MALVASSQSNKTLKFFSSKLYKIKARPLDFLVQNFGPFTTPRCAEMANLHAYERYNIVMNLQS